MLDEEDVLEYSNCGDSKPSEILAFIKEVVKVNVKNELAIKED